MWSTDIAVWMCTQVALACNLGSAPTLPIIQAAYDREIFEGSSLHDKGLRVLEAKCDAEGAGGRFLCQVTYLSTSDPTQRLYFDIVAVARKGAEWELKSGLCKR
jgi:hypothetical protein